MATQALARPAEHSKLTLERVASFPKMRVLLWDRDTLYASRGYALISARIRDHKIDWHPVGQYKPELFRKLTNRFDLSFRLVRDGFHALAITPAGNLIAAVPGAIATLCVGQDEFRVSHRLLRGTRPLHITAVPGERVFFGEYFDNPDRDEVHIYASSDGGLHWSVAHTFACKSIRHIHNIVYDRWDNCLWLFTGDYGSECRIVRTSLDFSTVEQVICGDQQARAVAAIVVEDGVYFASDTPLEQNYIHFLRRNGSLEKVTPLPSSSIQGCKNAAGFFFSTMVEPSEVNRAQTVSVFGSADGFSWGPLAEWRKDRWPSRFFQYGNAFFPDGENRTEFLAISTVAVRDADLETSLWRVKSE
jgi:hypothetical protein